jgi:hypothetical protein
MDNERRRAPASVPFPQFIIHCPLSIINFSFPILPMPPCSHLSQVRDVSPRSAGCEECLRDGTRWVHLRVCLSCGHVGCCDASPGRHATRHFHDAQHPVIRSLELGEAWRWCFPHQRFV